MPKRETIPTGAPLWIELFTSEPAKAREFYGQLFGWTAEESDDSLGGYANFRHNDERIAGLMPNDGSSGAPDMWSVYLATDDAQRTADATAAGGGQVYLSPMEVGLPGAEPLGSMAVLADAGGATVGAWQPGTHPGVRTLGEPGTPSWFELHTTAYDQAVRFYADVFGWDARSSDEGGFRYTTLGSGGDDVAGMAGIMDATLFGPDGSKTPGWSIYFNVTDPDTTAKQAVTLGGAILHEPEDTPFGRAAALTDPTGTVFKLIKPT